MAIAVNGADGTVSVVLVGSYTEEPLTILRLEIYPLISSADVDAKSPIPNSVLVKFKEVACVPTLKPSTNMETKPLEFLQAT